jgi:hypothetical protein
MYRFETGLAVAEGRRDKTVLRETLTPQKKAAQLIELRDERLTEYTADQDGWKSETYFEEKEGTKQAARIRQMADKQFGRSKPTKTDDHSVPAKPLPGPSMPPSPPTRPEDRDALVMRFRSTKETIDALKMAKDTAYTFTDNQLMKLWLVGSWSADDTLTGINDKLNGSGKFDQDDVRLFIEELRAMTNKGFTGSNDAAKIEAKLDGLLTSAEEAKKK